MFKSRTEMRQAFITMIIAALVMASCGKEKKADTAAADAAGMYYNKLIDGDYESFVAGMYFSDSIPAGYREQLVSNAKMFMYEQGKAHGGVDTAFALRQQRDSAATTAEVFMSIVFNDSSREEIVVPMIEENGFWFMR